MTRGEVEKILGECRFRLGPAAARDEALIALVAGVGITRSELPRLQHDDHDDVNGLLRIHKSNRLQSRTVPLSHATNLALRRWMHVRGDKPGPLFCDCGKGRNGKVHTKKMSDNAVSQSLQRRTRQAGVKYVSPDDLRKSCAIHMLEAGADFLAVDYLLGKKQKGFVDKRTTKRKIDVLRNAQEAMHGP